MRFDRSSILLSRIRYLVQSVLLFFFLYGGARNKFYKIKLLCVLFSSTIITRKKSKRNF